MLWRVEAYRQLLRKVGEVVQVRYLLQVGECHFHDEQDPWWSGVMDTAFTFGKESQAYNEDEQPKDADFWARSQIWGCLEAKVVWSGIAGAGSSSNTFSNNPDFEKFVKAAAEGVVSLLCIDERELQCFAETRPEPPGVLFRGG
jgi:hypothetical protein